MKISYARKTCKLRATTEYRPKRGMWHMGREILLILTFTNSIFEITRINMLNGS